MGLKLNLCVTGNEKGAEEGEEYDDGNDSSNQENDGQASKPSSF